MVASRSLWSLASLDAHLDAQGGVEIGERFVEQEDLRLAHDGAADGDALALAAGKLGRLALEQVLDLQDAGGVADLAVATSACGVLASLQGEADVVVDRHVRVERVGLEHHGDAAIARRARR